MNGMASKKVDRATKGNDVRKGDTAESGKYGTGNKQTVFLYQ